VYKHGDILSEFASSFNGEPKFISADPKNSKIEKNYGKVEKNRPAGVLSYPRTKQNRHSTNN